MTIRRFIAVLFVVCTAGVVAGLGVPAGAELGIADDRFTDQTIGDHGESAEETQLVEVQTVTTEGTEPGELDVELGYHVGDAIVEFDIQLVDSSATVVSLDGFEESSSNTYTWDEETDEPSIQVTVDANRTTLSADGYEFVETSEWAVVGPVDSTATLGALEEDIEDVERVIYLQSDEQSVSGQELLYLGAYEDALFESEREQFRVVVTDGATPETSIDEVGEALVGISDLLDVGGEAEVVTGFVVTDPLRQGGLARGADFWVHEDTLFEPRPTLYHEYVHTRQTGEMAESSAWTVEAEAEYYSFLLALKQGDIEYHEFSEFFADAETEHADVVLADSDTWDGAHPEDGARADYELGGLVLSALDAEIRAASDGTHSYEDVFRASNEHGGEVTDEDLEAFAADVADTDVSEFFERHIRSSPGPLSVPPPPLYDALADETTLSVELSETTVSPGERDTLAFEVENTGEKRSLAPFIEVELPSELDGGDVTVDELGGTDSDVTSVDDGWVLDHLEPDETVVLEYDVGVPDDKRSHVVDVTATDMSGTQATGNTELVVGDAPAAVLDVPAGVPVDEPAVLDASASSDATGIETYSWKIFGPVDNSDQTDSATAPGETTEETTEPTLEYEFDKAGEYRVKVGVENVDGIKGTTEKTVVASDLPEVAVDGPWTVDVGEPFFLNATVENEYGEYDVHWEVADEEATGERLELTLADAGERDITVTVEDEYGATATETVTVSANGEHEDTKDGDSQADSGSDDGFGPGLGFVTALVAIGLALVCTRYWKSL